VILKGSQRGGARQLAAHLLNMQDNDHITVEELRGFVADDLAGAMEEAHAIARGTRCRQCVFSLSLNPPKDGSASLEDLRAAADRAETVLGLEGQPRAFVVHEKNGRRHAHVVWSRIDADDMKAVNLPYYKNRLKDLSRELYLEHGWELPKGLRTNGWKNPLNFTLAQWQQAKRLDLDPREIKQVFQQAIAHADGLSAFRGALEDSGYFLARGDRRGFVALDMHGEVYALARWAGVRTKELNQKLGSPDGLPSVDAVRSDVRARMSKQLRGFIAEDKATKQAELKPLLDAQRDMVAAQRSERTRMDTGQKLRWEHEARARADRFRAGFGKVVDILTGKHFATRRQNEQEAMHGVMRDRAQREALAVAQLKEREGLARQMDAVRTRQRAEHMTLARRIAEVWRDSRNAPSGPEHERHKLRAQRNQNYLSL
jgi:hypothetical protein